MTGSNTTEPTVVGELVRISLRTSRHLGLNEHTPGSINMYIYPTGLVRIFVGAQLEQEANVQASSVYEYSITDVGENEQIHIDLTSYDLESNKYSLELFVKAKYESGQEFFVEQCLTSDSYALGIDLLNINDEISDPLNDNSNNNNNN